MASVVDICNLALSHLGDGATLSSIDPPEGSAQAEHCAMFYPIARDVLTEMHDWSFSRRRASLARLDEEPWAWNYVYARPANALRIYSVLPSGAMDTEESAEFKLGTTADGTSVIYSNTKDASALYSVRVADPLKYPPLFVNALGWLLASYLAGPLIKGSAGQKQGEFCLGVFNSMLSTAMASDANQGKVPFKFTSSMIMAR